MLGNPVGRLADRIRSSRTPHEASHGEEMGLRRIEEENRERRDDLGARFKRTTVAPTIFQKRLFGEEVERVPLA